MDARAREIEAVYRSRYVPFRNALATVTGSYESARDAVQEAFTIALRERRSFRGEGSLEAWIWRIALRSALRMRAGTESVLNGSLDPVLVEAERDPELAAALRTLSPRRRLIVFLRYFADLSYAEIARVCGVSEGTVGATLAQAHEALEEVLAPR